jgi:hypothetical protein
VSCYWYYECVDHDPPLRSVEEVTQHTDDVHYRRAVSLMAERPVDPHWENDYWRTGSIDTYFDAHAIVFLQQHPRCQLRMVSEAGEYRLEDGTMTYDPDERPRSDV